MRARTRKRSARQPARVCDLDTIAGQRGITTQRRAALVSAALENARERDTRTRLRDAQRAAAATPASGSESDSERVSAEVIVNALSQRLAFEQRSRQPAALPHAMHAARLIDGARRVPLSYTGGRDVLSLAIRVHPADDDSVDDSPGGPCEVFVMSAAVAGNNGYERAIAGLMVLAQSLDAGAVVDDSTIMVDV
ncbi:MAG: hypothetical protein AB7Q17_15305 [Phycisphaerae bacterium]